VAVDPAAPDAAETAARLRQAGHEILLAGAGLPRGATPQDVEVALSAYLDAIPGAIGVMDTDEGGFASNRAQSEQILEILGAEGYGVLLWDRGLNSAYAAAGRIDVPAALISRDLGGAMGSVSAVRRDLDRAAFDAARTGSVVVSATARPETLEALRLFARSDRAGQVALAPASAVLLGR
jgi:hypothetical protein